MRLAPGYVVDGRYMIERLLGQGGMGAVYVALEQALARRVAIKILLPDVAAHADAIARFEREGRAAAALESDHVTRIFSIGRLENGSPYIVMELLDGHDLADALEKRGPLPPHEVVHVMIDACDALSEAHARGIVHRDLKPANLFLAKRSNGSVTVKVLDFGISKAVGSGAPTQGLTGTTAMMGTPYYMSPEQIREAREVDARTDIWALGATMYELLSGRTPFNGATLADLCINICMAPHIAVADVRANVPRDLSAIVDRCLTKDPAQRFASAHDLAQALRTLGVPALTRNEPAFQPPKQLAAEARSTAQPDPTQLGTPFTSTPQPMAPPPMYAQTPMSTPQPMASPPMFAQTPIAATAAMTVEPVYRTAENERPDVPVKKVSLALVALAALLVGVVGVLVVFAALRLRHRDDTPVPASSVASTAKVDIADAGAHPPASIAPLPSAPPDPPPRAPASSRPTRTTPNAPPLAAPSSVIVPVPVVVPVPVQVPVPPSKPVTIPAGPPPIPNERR